MGYKFRLSPKVDNILLHKGMKAKSKGSLNIIIYLKHKSYQFYPVAVYTFLILSPPKFFICLPLIKSFSFFSIYFYQLEANYFTILQQFLPYIDMNQPWIYMYSPSRSPLPPPSPPDPSGSSQCTSPERLSHASNLGW